MASQLAMYENLVPLMAPISNTAAFYTAYVDLESANYAGFLVYYGVVTSTTVGDTIVMKVEAASAATTTGSTAIPFQYRVSAAAGANSWGAVTAATAAAGITTGSSTTFDGFGYILNVDPADVLNGPTNKNGRFMRLATTMPDGNYTVCNVAIWGIVSPRYKRLNMESTT